MGRPPCYPEQGLKKGAWSPEEDELLLNYINQHGHGKWRSLPKNAGLKRFGKSCRLRWVNYLRPGIKRDPFTPEEENLVIQLQALLGNRWAEIAIHVHGRTDNDIKNYWNTHLKKWLVTTGLNPQTHKPASKAASPSTPLEAQGEIARLGAEARFSRESLIYDPHCSSSSYSDVYLRLWNSEVGESFRKVAKNIKTEKSTCQSSVYETPPSIKCASSSGLTQSPGRTDSVIKNYRNTNLKKRIVTMGLDPQAPEPTSKAASRSALHKAQWESARLEAEARFSRESLMYNPHCSSSFYSDVYLRLWNSEVGESFRNVSKKIKTENSPVSETFPSTKCAFSSGLTQRDEDIEVNEDSKSHIVLLNARSTSSCYDVVDDSSVSELQLLLEFPENKDMSFLENPSYDYFDYPAFCFEQ